MSKNLVQLIHTYKSTRDDSFYVCLKILLNSKAKFFWIGLSVDIEPRISQVEFVRGKTLKDGLETPLIILSTHPLRRFQTVFKLKVIQALVNWFSYKVGFITSDGFSNLKCSFRSTNAFLISTWFNEPEESDLYWKSRIHRSSFKSIIEYFPVRPSVPITSFGNFDRRDFNFNFLICTKLGLHFPTKPVALFAGEINVLLRPHAVEYQNRLTKRYGEKINLDEFLWSHAEHRLRDLRTNTPFKVNVNDDGENSLTIPEIEFLPSEVELDGLRLSLHGRERFLYISAMAKSDLSENLALIGASWRQFRSISKFVIGRKRFPSALNVDELQRSRVCPDFGSTLGSMPQNVRAEILASRTVGLIQRRDPIANPFLYGLETERTFNSLSEFLEVSRKLMSASDTEIYKHAELIRSNYQIQRIISTEKFISSANEQMSKQFSC